MRSRFQRRLSSRRNERGYVLLTLLLVMALLIIFAAALVPPIKFDIQRDREEEMIHRGTQYSRAIRAYYKKFGRYPVKIEDLENTNNLKFLRKRYKDPTNCKGGTCQDFKLLHFGEVQMIGGMLGIPGATALGQGSLNAAGGNAQTAALINGAIAGQAAAMAGSGGFGASNSSPFGSNPAGQPAGSDPSAAGGDASNTTGSSGTDDGGNPAGGTTGSSGTTAGGGMSGNPRSPGTGQVFGGGPIVGVASMNKKETIREFNHKKKYNEWQFIYDPGTDRGGLLMTPNQPPLTPFGQQQPGTQNVNGQPGTTPTGLQNNPNTPGMGAPGSGQPAAPNDPNNPPEQK